jgi:hypothetical protein
MLAHYANPYSRHPFWRAREDDGAPTIEVRSPLHDGAGTALRPRLKVLERHLLLFPRSGQTAAVVYVEKDDGEAHWRLFLLVATVALVVAVKHFVERRG